MSGTTSSSSAAVLPPDPAAFGGAGTQFTPAVLNSYRITTVAERLAAHVQSGNHSQFGPWDFYNQCLSLARGIDYALANAEMPTKVDLPKLMKQLCRRKNDELSQAALMVLMISIKNACRLGWFQPNEEEELLSIANEIGKIYCSTGNIIAEPSSCHSIISTIMERFYPKMNLGQILVSVEAKPGYGACTVDFHITKSTIQQDKIWLLVAQTDNIETSACLISPQQVNFLLNGKAVDRRTNVFMDSGPQMPTNVTSMLKFGTNLVQAVGLFNGHYVILVAYMSFRSLPDHPILHDYVQPAVTAADTDSDVIEGASQISLNCPISFSRIKTPVKGRSCKHFQCFDFENFINMNARRPSWRCPHCNQFVSYADIRLDRNMVEILKDVGENIVEVIVLADGSWKAVLENDHNVDKVQNKAQNCEKEPAEAQESICSPTAVSTILDLTIDDDHMEIMDTFETVEKKPFPAPANIQFVTPNSTSLGSNSTGVNQNVATQIEDDFWSGLVLPLGRLETPTVGISEHPFLPDTVSPASLNQEAEGHDNNPALNSAMHYQVSTPSNLQLEVDYINSAVNEYGRSPTSMAKPNRTPVAVQALPALSPASGPQQNSRTNLDSLLPSSSTAAPRPPLYNTATADGSIAILSDTERQQHFSRSPMNLLHVSGVNSSALQHHSAPQNRVPPANNISASSPMPNPNRPSGLSDLRNPNLQKNLNPLAHPTQPRSHIQQGASNVQSAGASANTQQTRVNAPSPVSRQSPPVSGKPFTGDSLHGLTGDQRGKAGGTAQSVSRTDDLINLQSEQNWRPTSRMRGSLSGRQFSDDIRDRIIAPTQPVQGPRSQGLQQSQGSRPPGQLPVQSPMPQGQLPLQSQRPQGQLPVQSPRPQGQLPLQSQRSQGQLPLQSPRPQGQLPLQSQRPQGQLPVQSPRPQGQLPLQSPRPQGQLPVQSPRPQGQLPVQSPRPQGQLPVQIPRPQGQLPPQSPRPLGQFPVQSPRPQGHLPVQSPRPQGQLPAQSPRPQGQLPLQSPRPLGQFPVQSPRPQGQLPLQSPRPAAAQPSQPTSGSSQLNVLIANNRNAHNHPPNA